MQQLALEDTVIETVCIQPTKEMPLELFKVCHRLAYYIELMERVDDNHVIWDEALQSVYSEALAEAEYLALQNDWFAMSMELPAKLFNEHIAATTD